MHRSKLIEAIVYLLRQGPWRGRQQLYWALYGLEVSAQDRLSSALTGLEFVATAQGPCPPALDAEILRPSPDFEAAIALDVLHLRATRTLTALFPRREFIATGFTPAELERLRRAGGWYALPLPAAIAASEPAIIAAWQRSLAGATLLNAPQTGQGEAVPAGAAGRDAPAAPAPAPVAACR